MRKLVFWWTTFLVSAFTVTVSNNSAALLIGLPLGVLTGSFTALIWRPIR